MIRPNLTFLGCIYGLMDVCHVGMNSSSSYLKRNEEIKVNLCANEKPALRAKPLVYKASFLSSEVGIDEHDGRH